MQTKPPQTVALLDTTVHIDRRKMPKRDSLIGEMLSRYDWTVTTCISLLEFKAVLIQECITIHNALRRSRQFAWTRDDLIESGHRQTRLRSEIFNNLIQVFPLKGELTEEKDRRLAEKARLKLETTIPRLYRWFVEHSATGGVLNRHIKCTRADEPPTKKKAAFSPNLPRCRRGKNKFCNVEDFIRNAAPQLIRSLRDIEHGSEQLDKACELFEEVISDPNADISVNDCRCAGDCLIALEGKDVATHAVSSNEREWSALSEVFDMEFVKPDFSGEED